MDDDGFELHWGTDTDGKAPVATKESVMGLRTGLEDPSYGYEEGKPQTLWPNNGLMSLILPLVFFPIISNTHIQIPSAPPPYAAPPKAC